MYQGNATLKKLRVVNLEKRLMKND
jgi:hypothetical protein